MEELSREEKLEIKIKLMDGKIRKYLCQCVLLFLIAILIPICSYFSMFLPSNEQPDVWFQRSSSIVVIFAVWIEFKLFSINGDVNPTGVKLRELTVLTDKYSFKHKAASYFAALLAVFGTVVWGYGDYFM